MWSGLPPPPRATVGVLGSPSRCKSTLAPDSSTLEHGRRILRHRMRGATATAANQPRPTPLALKPSTTGILQSHHLSTCSPYYNRKFESFQHVVPWLESSSPSILVSTARIGKSSPFDISIHSPTSQPTPNTHSNFHLVYSSSAIHPSPSLSPNLTSPAPTRSQYLVNDIPRGTPMMKLVNYLLAPPHWSGELATLAGNLQPHVQFACNITDSHLDEELSVATIEFTETPKWLHLLNLDPTGYPKKTPLGTLWRGVDRAIRDSDGRTEFVRAAMADDLLDAEALAELPDTDVNVQDIHGRTALHWASVNNLPNIVMLCLSVPDCDVSLRDNEDYTAFDLALCGKNEVIPNLFYSSVLEMENHDPQAALLRILTVSSMPAQDLPVFPGEAMFPPAQARNLALVEALIGRGVDLTATNSDGDTALHVAAAQVGNTDIVRRLLEAGADIDATGSGGATAFQHAADEETLQALQQWKADLVMKDIDGTAACDSAEKGEGKVDQEALPFSGELELKNKKGRTILLQRAHAGDLEAVLGLIECGANVQAIDNEGWTALHLAAHRGHTETVTALLENGAMIGVPDNEAWMALHLAAQGGHTETAAALLSNGAMIEARAQRGRTALHLAAENGHIETVTSLLENGATIMEPDNEGWTALHLAAGNGHTEIVTALLDNGATIGAPDNADWMALHLAAQDGHTETVTALLSNGATIEARAQYGWTALHLAAHHGHTETVAALLSSEATIEARGEDDRTALHLAAQSGHTEIVTALLSNGATIEARAQHGWAALHLATHHGYTETVDALLSNGATIDARGEDGRTALHLAAHSGHTDIVTALLSNGATTEEMTSDQQTPLHIAILSNQLAIVERLLDHGARIEARCDEGTGLQVALQYGHTELAQMLVSRGAQTSLELRLPE